MGDVQITLGGRAYPMRPTFGAMREIETQCNSSCATLMQLLARYELHVAEMAWIVFYGAQAAGSNLEAEAIGKRLFEAGVGTDAVRHPIAEFLCELLYAPETAKKNNALERFREIEGITSQMLETQPEPSGGQFRSYTDIPPESSGPSSSASVKEPSRSNGSGDGPAVDE